MEPMHRVPIPGLAPLDVEAVPWRPTRSPGVFWLPLHLDERPPDAAAGERAFGGSTVLIRMDPGCGYPRHEHLGVEEVLCLAGGYTDELGTVRAGDFVRYEAGSAHAPVALEGEACILFAVARGGTRLV